MTFGWTSPREAAVPIFDAFRAAGGNFFDTADVYSRWAQGNPGGVAEELLGGWLKTQPRDQIVIASKVSGPMGDGPNDSGLSRAHIMTAVEGSLRRLGTDYIDVYQAHHPDENTPLEETLRAFDDLVHQGKVCYLGCSNQTASEVLTALWVSDKHGLAAYTSVQPRYSLIMRADFERELMAVCRVHGLGVMAYAPLGAGVLTGKYRPGEPVREGTRGAISEYLRATLNEKAFRTLNVLERHGQARGKTVLQMALGWVLTNPVVTCPIVGVNSIEQWQEAAGAIGLRLTPKEKEQLDEASKWQKAWGEE